MHTCPPHTVHAGPARCPLAASSAPTQLTLPPARLSFLLRNACQRQSRLRSAGSSWYRGELQGGGGIGRWAFVVVVVDEWWWWWCVGGGGGGAPNAWHFPMHVSRSLALLTWSPLGCNRWSRLCRDLHELKGWGELRAGAVQWERGSVGGGAGSRHVPPRCVGGRICGFSDTHGAAPASPIRLLQLTGRTLPSPQRRARQRTAHTANSS